jgi:hypothetical protein
MLLFGFGVTVMSVVVGVERAATPVMLLTMGWLARRMRWMLYEDRDGFLDFEPSILFWGIVTRLPYAYALTVAGLVGSDAVATMPVLVGCAFAPLPALAGYLASRYYRLDGRMYLRFPRAEHDPDEWDVFEYIRRTSPHLTHEQAQALRPKNRVWTNLSRAATALRAVNREAADHDLPQISPQVITNLTYRTDTSAARRRMRIGRARRALTRVSHATDDSDESTADLDEAIRTAERSLESASTLNEEVGEDMAGRLNELLFR